MTEAIAALKQRGAVIVDPADIPSVVDHDVSRNFLRWEVCRGTDGPKGMDAGCSVVFKYGMKRDFNKWLASLGPTAPVKSLTELRHWNLAHVKAGAKYGQSQLDISDEIDIEADRTRYEIDRAEDVALSGAHGIDEIMQAERLDAILFPAGSGAILSARPGYPTVIVPFAMVANAQTPPIPQVSMRSFRPSASASRGRLAASRGSSRSPTPSSKRRNDAFHPPALRSHLADTTPHSFHGERRRHGLENYSSRC